MQLISRVLNYSAAFLFGVAAWVAVIAAVVIVLHWDGAVEFLFGA